MAPTTSVVLRRLRKDGLKRGDYIGVELASNRLSNSKTRDPRWHRVPIWSIRRHSIIRIGDSDNPRNEWNLIANQLIWIPLPVYTLMMMANDIGDLFIVLDVCQDSLADYWVLFHQSPFLKMEWPWLFQKTSRKSNLANVVNESAQVSGILINLTEA